MEEKQKRKTSLKSLFLCDVDGTLIHKIPEIDALDVQAIQAWQKAGNEFGLVTGRDAVYCRALLGKYGIEPDCLITCNGSITYHKEELVSSFLIDLSQAIDIYQSLASNFDVDAFYTDVDGKNYFLHHGNIQNLKEQYNYLGNIEEESVLSFLKKKTDGVAKISVSMRTPENLQAYLPLFQERYKNVEVMATSVDYIEMTRKNTNKATALRSLMNLFSYASICFVGDGSNDIPLFKELENTYVMKQADSHVKKCAKYIVSSVSEAITLESERMKHV